jgi:cytochrome c-type biogenesis protein CcmH
MKRAAWVLCAALLAPLAWATDQPQQQAVDPDRLYRLTSELRCLVCQNESLADSNADLAIDLKNEIRARMASGESDAQIKKFLVDRYGNFVIYRPPFDATTLLLWLGPLLLAAGGLFAVWRSMRAASAHGAAEPDEPDESDELNQPRREESAP